jgi:Flp pilus assembly protein TadG
LIEEEADMMVRGALRIVRSARATWQRLGRDRSGSVVSFLVVIPVLMGAAAVGIETGQLYRTKRQMQGAADAAALAGSVDRTAGKNLTTITSTARYEAQRNGFQNGVGSISVTVNAPPTSGTNIATAGAVEVIITKPQSFSLGAVLTSWLGGTSGSFTMSTRSVAAQKSSPSAEGCMVALTNANEQGVSFTSFTHFNADCTIVSNGSSTATGSTASIYLASFNSAALRTIWTRGRFVADVPSNVTLTNAAQENQTTAVVDPYLNLPAPTPGGCPATPPYTPPATGDASPIPGVYCGGLTLTSRTNVNFSPGIYYITNGDLYINSVNNVRCPTCTTTAGVTFVLTQNTGLASDIGGVSISSANTVTLNAPSGTGASPPPYAGVLFYQDRAAPVGTMTSTSKIFAVSSINNVTLTGAIYFPSNKIEVTSLNNGGSSSTGCTVYIGRYIKFTDYNNIYIAGCPSIGTTPASIMQLTTMGRVFE